MFPFRDRAADADVPVEDVFSGEPSSHLWLSRRAGVAHGSATHRTALDPARGIMCRRLGRRADQRLTPVRIIVRS